MTATQTVPVGRRYRFSIVRIFICGILLSVLIAACLYVYHTALTFYHARFVEEESKTIAWLLKQVSFALPWIIICLFHGIVYHKHDRHDGICQREMFWEVVLAAVLTYCVLLPYLWNLSDTMYAAALEMGADIPQTDGKYDQTLIMKFHEWFVRLSIPLGILILFHGARARREVKYPVTETAEPVITKAEYDAMRIATMAQAEDEAAVSEENSTPEVPVSTPDETNKEVSAHE